MAGVERNTSTVDLLMYIRAWTTQVCQDPSVEEKRNAVIASQSAEKSVAIAGCVQFSYLEESLIFQKFW